MEPKGPNVIIAYSAENYRDVTERAVVTNSVDALRRLDQAAVGAAEVFHSWAVSVGGSVVQCSGASGVLQVPAAELGGLDHIRAQFGGALDSRASCGIGIDLEQARRALDAAIKNGGDRIEFYSSKMAPPPEESSEITPNVDDSLIKSCPPVPRDYDAEFRAHADRQEELARTAAVAQSGRLQEIRAQLAATLQVVAAQMPALRALQESAPEAHGAILGLVQGVIALGREIRAADAELGGLIQEDQETIAKDELPNVSDVIEKDVEASEVSPESTEFNSTTLEKDGVDGTKGAQFKGMNLPVGTTFNGRVKVKHGDGGTSWVGGRHGLVQANDPNRPVVGASSHPVSSLRPEGK